MVAHGRFSTHGRPAAWIAADIVRIEEGKLAEHWDVLQDEAPRAEFQERLADVWPALSTDRLAPTEVVELVDDF